MTLIKCGESHVNCEPVIARRARMGKMFLRERFRIRNCSFEREVESIG